MVLLYVLAQVSAGAAFPRRAQAGCCLPVSASHRIARAPARLSPRFHPHLLPVPSGHWRLCLTADAGSGDPTGPRAAARPTSGAGPARVRWVGAATACSKAAPPRAFQAQAELTSCRLSGLGRGE